MNFERELKRVGYFYGEDSGDNESAMIARVIPQSLQMGVCVRQLDHLTALPFHLQLTGVATAEAFAE
jgi:hypothetical protein